MLARIVTRTELPLGGFEGDFLRKRSPAHSDVEWVRGGPFVHNQTVDSTEWIVNHNLGRLPVVSVLSVGLVEILAEVTHTTLNQVRVRFLQPHRGTVICI